MQAVKDYKGLTVQIPLPFYACHHCNAIFVNFACPDCYSRYEDRNIIPLECMFCNKTFTFPAQRDYHMIYRHMGEEKPVIHCFQCSTTFECIHDKEEHSCEKEAVPQRKVPRIGNPLRNEVILWTRPGCCAIVGDVPEPTSALWNIHYPNACCCLNLPKPIEEKHLNAKVISKDTGVH